MKAKCFLAVAAFAVSLLHGHSCLGQMDVSLYDPVNSPTALEVVAGLTDLSGTYLQQTGSSTQADTSYFDHNQDAGVTGEIGYASVTAAASLAISSSSIISDFSTTGSNDGIPTGSLASFYYYLVIQIDQPLAFTLNVNTAQADNIPPSDIYDDNSFDFVLSPTGDDPGTISNANFDGEIQFTGPNGGAISGEITAGTYTLLFDDEYNEESAVYGESGMSSSFSADDDLVDFEVSPVPEPSTWSILSLAGLSLFTIRRQKPKRTASSPA